VYAGGAALDGLRGDGGELTIFDGGGSTGAGRLVGALGLGDGADTDPLTGPAGPTRSACTDLTATVVPTANAATAAATRTGTVQRQREMVTSSERGGAAGVRSASVSRFARACRALRITSSTGSRLSAFIG
jgi:hypothetical protein